MRSRTILIVAVTLLAVILASCGGGSDAGSAERSTPDAIQPSGMNMGGDGSFTFGMPGDPADVDRVVRIEQSDEFRFVPGDVGVSMGETIRFEVTNTGMAQHEFVLGDEAFQDEHETEMAEMGGMMATDEPNAIVVDPGQTKSLVWTFAEAGTVLIGCHIPGHYAAGMVGEVAVSA